MPVVQKFFGQIVRSVRHRVISGRFARNFSFSSRVNGLKPMSRALADYGFAPCTFRELSRSEDDVRAGLITRRNRNRIDVALQCGSPIGSLVEVACRDCQLLGEVVHSYNDGEYWRVWIDVAHIIRSASLMPAKFPSAAKEFGGAPSRESQELDSVVSSND